MNRLAVTLVIPLGHSTEAAVLFADALASQEANQDPIDLAIVAAAKERHVFGDPAKVTPLPFAPFDAKNRRTEAVVEQDGHRLRVMKGAVRTVADACGLQPSDVEEWEAKVGESAAKGDRTIGLGPGPETGAVTLVGLVSLYDPPRPDAGQLIADLKERGVTVKILTGDELAVASKIARDVGLPNIRRMADLRAGSTHAGYKTIDRFAGADGFAEVFPEDKYVVVKRLQVAGHVTGMTGDGVNDAPGLRQAEVGIAVNTATDVAKAAASVVLTEPGPTNIVALVEQGRTIYPGLPLAPLGRAARSAPFHRAARGRGCLLGLWPLRRPPRKFRGQADVGLQRGGGEIMAEILDHLRIEAEAEHILETTTCIPCMMPFITGQFFRRERGDRPRVIPEGTTNLAFVGQFRELPDDVVFTVEYSIRSAQTAVYALLGLDREPPAVFKGTYDPRVLYRVFMTLHVIGA